MKIRSNVNLTSYSLAFCTWTQARLRKLQARRGFQVVFSRLRRCGPVANFDLSGNLAPFISKRPRRARTGCSCLFRGWPLNSCGRTESPLYGCLWIATAPQQPIARDKLGKAAILHVRLNGQQHLKKTAPHSDRKGADSKLYFWPCDDLSPKWTLELVEASMIACQHRSPSQPMLRAAHKVGGVPALRAR